MPPEHSGRPGTWDQGYKDGAHARRTGWPDEEVTLEAFWRLTCTLLQLAAAERQGWHLVRPIFRKN